MGSQPSPGLDPGTPPSPNGAEEVEVQAPEAARWAWAAAPRRPRARRPRPRRSFTPSTGTPDTESRPTSSSFGGTWPDLADEEEDDFADDPDPLPEAAAVDRLSEARQKSNNSMEALRLNLAQSGHAWPVGCAVEVLLPPGVLLSRWSCQSGRLVNYDPDANCLEVCFTDGSTHTVPVNRARRLPMGSPTGNGSGVTRLPSREILR